MKPGVIVAIFISLLLVIGAFWIRSVESESGSGNLVAVANQPLPESYYDELLSKFLDTASSTPAQPENLTTTDLIGRQMILEYVSLAQAGQDTPDNLEALADKYVQSIPTIISYSQYLPTNLQVVSSTPENFQTYSSAMDNAYAGYIEAISSQASVEITPESLSDLAHMSNTYKDLVEKLKKIKVPSEVAEMHSDLINIYIENAVSMDAISSSADVASSFSGLIALKKNAEKEASDLSSIKKVLEKNGV